LTGGGSATPQFGFVCLGGLIAPLPLPDTGVTFRFDVGGT